MQKEKIRVLFLSYNGLLEPILPSQAVPYLEGLSKKGYDFILLTYEKRKDLERVGKKGVLREQEELKAKGIEWHHLAYHKIPPLFSTIFDLKIGILYTWYLIISRKIKIVHVRGITPGVIMLFLINMLRVKVLFDMRGLLAEEYVGGGLWREGGAAFRLVKRAEQSMLEASDGVIVLTQKHLDMNKGLDYLAGRDIPMDVVPCCVDLKRFYPDDIKRSELRRSLGIDRNFVLMYPGKIGTFYFMDEMLLFFKRLIAVMPEPVFFLITNDDPSGVLKKAADMGIPADRIKVKQGIQYDEMPLYMRLADAGVFFINPYKKFGSSPIKMGEFLASGVPVIINPGIGDTEELVRENRVGVVVNAFKDDLFDRAINELSTLCRDGNALSQRCVGCAREYLSLEMGIERYDNMYKRILCQNA